MLRQIKRNDADGDRDSIQLRFADDGTVSFMQRQLATRREPLTRDEIALYQYQARRILEVSKCAARRQGEVAAGALDGARCKPATASA